MILPKHLLNYVLTTVFAFVSVVARGQVTQDSTVLSYIKSMDDEYVALNDVSRMPDEAKVYVTGILAYMKQRNMNSADYWLWMSYLRTDSDTVVFPICHYSGFVRKLDLEKQNKEANKDRKPGEPRIVHEVIGNRSGVDGSFTIDKKTRKILSFALWQ